MHYFILFSEKETEIAGIRGKLQLEINQLESLNRSLREELASEKELLEKARSGLDAARHLNLQIEEKGRVISSLRSQGRHTLNLFFCNA